MDSGVIHKIKGRNKGFETTWQQDLGMSPHFSTFFLCLASLSRQVLADSLGSHPYSSATPAKGESLFLHNVYASVPEKSSGSPSRSYTLSLDQPLLSRAWGL